MLDQTLQTHRPCIEEEISSVMGANNTAQRYSIFLNGND